MENLGSNYSSSSTAVDLELHRPLPENSPASSSTSFVSSSSTSVYDSFTSRNQSHQSSANDPVLQWWEIEAKDILRGGDPQSIRLVCQYRIYRDSSIPATILQANWTHALDTFLRRMIEDVNSMWYIDDLGEDQKVGLLLRLLEPLPPAGRTWLHPLLPALQPNAAYIASELDKQSWSLFKDITFSEFVREALYPEQTIEPVETFRDWHDSLFYAILDYLEEFPAEHQKFVQVQQLLPERSPLYLTIAQSLHSTRARCPDMMFSDPASLEMICGPLRSLVRNQHGNLLGILKHLAVLEARFQRRYLWEEEMDWTRDFDTDTNFFDGVTTISPRDLAGVLTESDLDLFRQLDPEDIIKGGPHLQHMHREWNRRCQAAQESIAVESYLSTRLVHLAQELCIKRNFYSLSAILQALRETRFDESELPHLFKLIDPYRNYMYYREIWRKEKGLPFLSPHIEQRKIYQQQAVLEMVPAGGFEKSINSTSAQVFEQQEPPLETKQVSWNIRAWLYITHHVLCFAARRNKLQIGEAFGDA